MNQNICNICGDAYVYRGGRWVCPSCGAYKAEELSNEEVTLLYNAAQKLRLANFDEAEQAYTDIIEKFPQNPQGYWGRLLSKYGIKYERDYDGRTIPTCCSPIVESLFSDKDYASAIALADNDTKQYFQSQAEYIESVRDLWVKKASKEKPYDIFICYKDSDLANGIDRTRDSIDAQELYIHLTEQGYRVFFSRESLRNKIGEKYEPYIFGALASAKVMIVYGSSSDYITSTWLKNEWIRYQKMMRDGVKKPNSLIVAYKGFSPSKLPSSLSSAQCLDASGWNFYPDLDKAVDLLLNKKLQKAKEKEEKEKERQERKVEEKKKPTQKLSGKFILTLLFSIITGAFAIFSYVNHEMLLAFKISMIVEIIMTVALLISMFNHMKKIKPVAIRLLLVLFFVAHVFCSFTMIRTGRFGVDEIVKDDNGYMYDVIDGAYYLYSWDEDTTGIVFSELHKNVVGISSECKANDTLQSMVIDVPKFTVQKKAFANWKGLIKVTFSVEECTVSKKAFQNCTSLESIIFKNGNYTIEGGYVFKNCLNLKDVHFEGGRVETKNKEVWKGTDNIVIHLNNVDATAYLYGAKHTTVVVYEGTNLFTNFHKAKCHPDVLVIDDGFDFDDNNWKVKKTVFDISSYASVVYIPCSVTNIPDHIFGTDEKYYNVYYQGSEDMWQNIVISGTGALAGTNSNYTNGYVKMRYLSDCKYWNPLDLR